MGRKKLYRNESKFSLDGNDKRTQKWRDVFAQNKMSHYRLAIRQGCADVVFWSIALR